MKVEPQEGTSVLDWGFSFGYSSHRMGWRQFSECAGVSLVEKGYFFSEDPDEIVAAQVICSSCFIRDDCLTYAIKTSQPQGVWGMHTTEDRRWLRRRVSRSVDPYALLCSSFERVEERIGQALGMDVEAAECPVVTAV